MKTQKIILALSCLAIITICAINMRNELITLKIAHASYAYPIDCTGPDCDDANGNKYWTGGIGDNVRCCGVASSERGKKKGAE